MSSGMRPASLRQSSAAAAHLTPEGPPERALDLLGQPSGGAAAVHVDAVPVGDGLAARVAACSSGSGRARNASRRATTSSSTANSRSETGGDVPMHRLAEVAGLGVALFGQECVQLELCLVLRSRRTPASRDAEELQETELALRRDGADFWAGSSGAGAARREAVTGRRVQSAPSVSTAASVQ